MAGNITFTRETIQPIRLLETLYLTLKCRYFSSPAYLSSGGMTSTFDSNMSLC